MSIVCLLEVTQIVCFAVSKLKADERAGNIWAQKTGLEPPGLATRLGGSSVRLHRRISLMTSRLCLASVKECRGVFNTGLLRALKTTIVGLLTTTIVGLGLHFAFPIILFLFTPPLRFTQSLAFG